MPGSKPSSTKLLLAVLLAGAIFACRAKENPGQTTPSPALSAATPLTSPVDPAPISSAFRPSLHGFAFRNAFSGSPLPHTLRPLESVLGTMIPSRFGLCGGMSALAADYFLADLTIPPQSSIPADGELLYDAIYSRQVDSLGRGFTVATKILRWMAAPDTGPTGLRARTASEHARVTARLARGELVQLALVLGRADGRTKLWENHQVLAYALTDDTPIAAIRIYDPNYPKDDSARLVFEPSPAADALSCVRLTANDRRSVRGVFAIEYEHKRPGSGSIHLENAGLK